MKKSSTESIVQDIQAGKMVIIVDDESRENEGDLVIAASKVTAEDINFMTKYGRGLICLTLTEARCNFFKLPLMVESTNELHTTNFTISIESREGVTTGISAQDRALTIQVAADPASSADALVQPGHIFPLMSQPGGVLARAGHTEAGCDLARLAGLPAAAAIVEILNDDGTVARRDDLYKFAQLHGLKLGLIEDLIKFRVENEQTVIHLKTLPVETDFGSFHLHIYEDLLEHTLHFALVKGQISHHKSILIRVHVEEPLVDTIGLQTQYDRWPVTDALQRINTEGCGVVIFLRQSRPDQRIRMQLNTMRTKKLRAFPSKPVEGWRTLGLGGQMLKHLGVKSMRLMSAPQKFYGLGGFGLSIDDFIEN